MGEHQDTEDLDERLTLVLELDDYADSVRGAMKVIAITKVETSNGETVDRMQTMIVALQPGDKALGEMPTAVYVRPDDFDANTLLSEASRL